MNELSQALHDGDVPLAEVLMGLIAREEGVDVVHRELAQVLSEAGETWASGGGVLQERRRSRTVQALLERDLPYPQTGQTRGTVLLTVPEGERHTLALLALGQRFRCAGWYALILDEIPYGELARHCATEDAAALVVSTHLPMTPAQARRLVDPVREASPGTLIAFGGPGAHGRLRSPDVVTDDVNEVLQLLESRRSVLTGRETEILVLVAEGLTNADIAVKIGVSGATVKTHMDHIFAKTGSVHRAAAVAHALRSGWIQ